MRLGKLEQFPAAAAGGGGGAVAWADVTGKPATFPPAAHTHPWSEITSLPAAIDAIDGLTPAADRLAFYTGGGSAALTPLTAAARALLDDADAAAMRATLGAAAATHTHASGDVTDFAEAVDDRVAALLVAGANVTLTYNDAANTLTIAAAGAAGATEPTYFRALAADAAGQNVNTAQPWFPSGGALTVDAGLYRFEGLLLLNSGVTSHRVGVSFAGTSARTGAYLARGTKAAIGTGSTVETTNTDNSGGLTTNRVVTAANTTAAAQVHITGLLRVSATGTLIPQFTYSAAPGSSTVLANTHFAMWAWSATSSAASKGTWA